MKNIVRLEFDKIVHNVSFLVTAIITIIVMGCIFYWISLFTVKPG